MGSEQVGQAPLEWRLGTDDREVDVFSGGQREQVVGSCQVGGETGAQVRHARVSWSNQERRDLWISPKAPGQGVFTPTRTDNQDFHRMIL